jgi:hypothetical protein
VEIYFIFKTQVRQNQLVMSLVEKGNFFTAIRLSSTDEKALLEQN